MLSTAIVSARLVRVGGSGQGERGLQYVYW